MIGFMGNFPNYIGLFLILQNLVAKIRSCTHQRNKIGKGTLKGKFNEHDKICIYWSNSVHIASHPRTTELSTNREPKVLSEWHLIAANWESNLLFERHICSTDWKPNLLLKRHVCSTDWKPNLLLKRQKLPKNRQSNLL